MDTTSIKLDNVCQHGFWVGQGAAPCPFCHPECYANGTQGTIAPLITVNVNTIFDAVKDARIAALESALAAAREAGQQFGKDQLFHRCKNGEVKPYPCLLCSSGCSGTDFNAFASLRARDEGRVERAAKALPAILKLGQYAAATEEFWIEKARAVLAAADGREP